MALSRSLSSEVVRPKPQNLHDGARAGVGRSRTLGDSFDSFEGAEHVTPVATLPQKAAERAPDLGEEVVAEVE